MGDEIDIANEDLIVTIDGSGLLDGHRVDNWKKFDSSLLNFYCLFVSGQKWPRLAQCSLEMVSSNGSTIVSPIRSEHGLRDQIADAITKTESLSFKKGLTNMAQVFSIAEANEHLVIDEGGASGHRDGF